MIFFKISVLCVIAALFLGGCDNKSNCRASSSDIITSNQPQFFVLLGPISDANVDIIDLNNNQILYKTKTKAYDSESSTLEWTKYQVGSFEVDINSTLLSNAWINIKASSGVDIDSDDDGIVTNTMLPLNGNMNAYCKIEDLNNSDVIVNIFTTLGVEFYLAQSPQNSKGIEEFLNEFANTVFAKSIDNYDGIDYRDLFAYIPNETSDRYLVNSNLYKKLLEYGVMNLVLNNENILNVLNIDADSDGLSLWSEILNNSSPLLMDSDNDGLDDGLEVSQGLNPALSDSDFDGIDDYNESLYMTSPLNSDTDGDYIPDNVELLDNSDPLNSDENNNGIVDGLDGDPYFKYQWYIKSLGDIVANTVGVSTIIGNDLNILGVYHKVIGNNSGKNTIIQVVDTGVELLHEDLDVDLTNSFNAVTKSNDPTATFDVIKNDFTSPLDSGHGTAVAGIIAARTNNNLGVRGIVPRARIAGSNWLEDQTLGEIERVWYSQINSEDITVSNNSWGSYYFKDDGFERILALATSQLREGKGRIYTFAAGNSREDHGNSNLSYLTNNPYVITVASLNANDKYASYSNPGSSILVSAYGGEHYYTGPTIMTTVLSGKSYYEAELNGAKGTITVDEDSARNYTYAMNGTSSATPMVSGAIALVIDACPSLSWRDVRWLIANSSTVIDKLNDSWVKNGAGLEYSIDYGYGKINPSAMIDMCRSANYINLPVMKSTTVSEEYTNTIIPDNNTSIIKEISIVDRLKIEWIGLTIDTPHAFAGDLEINLISPMGTKINIIKPNEVTFAGYENGFRFGSVGYIDEESDGVWKIEIIDRLENDEGSLKSISLEIHGYEE